MTLRSPGTGLAALVLGCLGGPIAASSPDGPVPLPVLAAPQLTPSTEAIPNRWLDPDPIFQPPPAPASALEQALTATLRHAIRPLLSRLPRPEAAPPADGLGWLHGVEQLGLCWWVQATEPLCRRAAADERAHATVESRVERLMRACYRAIGEGDHRRAAALARRAHRLDPGRVEGDPLVYKLDLLSQPVSRRADEP